MFRLMSFNNIVVLNFLLTRKVYYRSANANRQNKKSQRKTREVEEYSVTSQPVVAQNMGPMMAPLLQGSQTYQHMPSTSSNR